MASKLPALVSISRLTSTPSLLVTSSTPLQQKRTITRKSCFVPPKVYEPWPYKEKGFTQYHFFVDWTKKRLNENSKLIVVEGNIGSGKSTAAAQIADTLGFYHMPEFSMDHILIDRYENDLRKYYHLFPKSFRYPDVEMFYANPFDDNVAKMQYRIFECRWEQYINAVAHILNTGQGVVLERSPYTDFVFTNAMRSKNYISMEFFKFYYYVRKLVLPDLRYWPHLVIYLDAPVDKCLERIRQRGRPNEIACVDETYLKTIEESYKDALREHKNHSKILAYDWSTPGDPDTIVEDIEKLELNFFEWHSGDVFEEWHEPRDEYWYSFYRYKFTDKIQMIYGGFNGFPTHEVGELYHGPQDLGHFLLAMKKHVLKNRYGYGYQPQLGDEKGDGMRVSKWGYHLPEKWFEYWWKDQYYHRLHCWEAYGDPHAYSYDPDYVHGHH